MDGTNVKQTTPNKRTTPENSRLNYGSTSTLLLLP